MSQHEEQQSFAVSMDALSECSQKSIDMSMISGSTLPSSETTSAAIVHQEIMRNSNSINLTRLESQFFSAVVEDAICQLTILGSCNKELVARQPVLENTGLVPMPINEERMETIDMAELSKEAHKFVKMNKDRKNITEILARLYFDLKNNLSYATLSAQLTDLVARSDRAVAHEIRNKENRNTMRTLQQTLRSNTSNHRNILHDCELEICRLLDEIDDSTWNSDIKTRYIMSWQRAREEQHSLAIEQEESKYTSHLVQLELKVTQEMRVHDEICKYILQSTEGLSEQIEDWMKRFDDEQEQLDLDIRILREKRDQQLEDTAELQSLFDKHKKEMDEWLEFTGARERAANQLIYENFCATKIQAWWRGFLERKRLAKERKAAKKKAAKEAKLAKAKAKKGNR